MANGTDARLPPMADVAVVGGGVAGMTAAMRAVELGLRVVLLERGADPDYPCNTRFSGGILHLAHLDVNRPANELADAVDEATGGQASADLVSAFAEDGRRLLAWLRGKGVRFMRFTPLEAHKWGMAPPRPIAPGLDWRGRGPDAMLRTLRTEYERHGGAMVLGARVEHLARTRESDWSLRDSTGGEIAARTVVIADGGFQSNAEMFRQYIGPSPERILQRGAATGSGDGLRMAMSVGAAVTDLSRFYGHLHHRAALTDPRLWPYPDVDVLATAGIVINGEGERFVDEGLGGISIANSLAKRDDPTAAFAVFDAGIWDGPARQPRVPPNPFLERFGGVVMRAASPGALANAIGVPPSRLADTIAAYNATTPKTVPRSGKPRHLDTGALMAVPLCVGITYTMGGLHTDSWGRVEARDGGTIPGLFAAGAAAGGMEGGVQPKVGYVGGIIKAVLGLRAAECIAAEAKGMLVDVG